jgi:hypothetical protein
LSDDRVAPKADGLKPSRKAHDLQFRITGGVAVRAETRSSSSCTTWSGDASTGWFIVDKGCVDFDVDVMWELTELRGARCEAKATYLTVVDGRMGCGRGE